ncbi:hypothetical protein GCM10010199_53110 [Dactylosporangium roseum]
MTYVERAACWSENVWGILVSVAAHFDNYSTARAHFKDILDAAGRGRVATVQRETDRAAVLDAERLRVSLVGVLPLPQVVAEVGGWSVLLPGAPIAAEATTRGARPDRSRPDRLPPCDRRTRAAPTSGATPGGPTRQHWPTRLHQLLNPFGHLSSWLDNVCLVP